MVKLFAALFILFLRFSYAPVVQSCHDSVFPSRVRLHTCLFQFRAHSCSNIHHRPNSRVVFMSDSLAFHPSVEASHDTSQWLRSLCESMDRLSTAAVDLSRAVASLDGRVSSLELLIAEQQHNLASSSTASSVMSVCPARVPSILQAPKPSPVDQEAELLRMLREWIRATEWGNPINEGTFSSVDWLHHPTLVYLQRGERNNASWVCQEIVLCRTELVLQDGWLLCTQCAEFILDLRVHLASCGHQRCSASLPRSRYPWGPHSSVRPQ